MPVDALTQFILENPEWGWLIVAGGATEQIFAPWETKTKGLIGRVEKRVENVEDMGKAQMTVIRALVRVHDDIDTERVDDYLVENGVEPDEFIREPPEEDADGAD